MTREPKIEIYQGGSALQLAGVYYWSLRAANGRIVADGAEGYDSERNAKRAIARLKDSGVLSRELKVVVL